MKYITTILYSLFCLISSCLSAQQGNSIETTTTEIVTAKALGKLPVKNNTFPANTTFELDIDEQFYYQIRNESIRDPSTALPIGTLVEEVEYFIKFGEQIFGPFKDDNISRASGTSTRYSRNCRQLLNPVKNEVLSKLTSRNINDLSIYLKVKWFSKDAVDKASKAIKDRVAKAESKSNNTLSTQTKPTRKNSEQQNKSKTFDVEPLEGWASPTRDNPSKEITDSVKTSTPTITKSQLSSEKTFPLTEEELKEAQEIETSLDGLREIIFKNITGQKIDNFIINVKKFGLVALIDASPLSKDGANLALDVVNGLFKNLAKTSVDYSVVLNKPNFSNLLITVPFFRYDGRSWLSKNFDLEAVFATDLAERSKDIGFGLAVGAFGVKDKGIKVGTFWVNKQPNVFFGLSVRGIASFISNYK